MDKVRIAEAYLEAYPVTFESKHAAALPTVIAYAALAQESQQLANVIRGRFIVEEVADPEPYKTAAEMFAAQDLGFFQVSNLFCEHPLWTPEENIAFRITHDWFGHYDAKAPFSWKGELAAYYSQCRVHSRLAQRALFTEVVGQTACFSLTGEFPEQKAILLPRELDV